MRYLSLFSGIEAASVAWKPLGWQCVGVAEIDPFPCAVLKHHYPDVPNLGSVTDITDAQIAALGPIDVVVGGSPCQDLSVAGKRAGLAGERSGLFHEQLRIFHAARHLCGARFLLWENVPGAFSSNRGLDFAVVVGAMAGCRLPVPEDGWGTEGVALGEHGLVEWAVLDAQWFGVAQRRRRVFAVLDAGDWANRPPILLEPDSLRGDSAPSREARQVAPTIPSRRTGGGGLGSDFDCDGGLILAFGGNNQSGQIDVATARNACASASGRMDFESETFLVQPAHTLRGEGFDGSEDGTGRGTPLVPVSGVKYAHYSHDYAHDRITDPAGCAPALTEAAYASGNLNVAVPVAFSAKDYGADASDIAPTLQSMGHDGSHANGGGQVAVAYMADDYKDGGYEECDTARPLTTSADRTRAAPVVTTETVGAMSACGSTEKKHGFGWGQQDYESGYCQPTPCLQVRRLTVIECSRLQGFPDDYLLQVPWRGKTPPPDGPMYKALGNSFAVPVVRWIGRRIAEVTA